MGEGSPRLRPATGLTLVNLYRFNNDRTGLVRRSTGLIGAFEIEPVLEFAVLKLADMIFIGNRASVGYRWR